MLNSFIDFTASLFPAITPYTQEKTKKALEQFRLKNNDIKFLNEVPFEHLAQGDIFDGINFFKICENGDLGASKEKAILISNSCSAENHSEIILAPMYEIQTTGLNLKNVEKNDTHNLMYIPEEKYKNYVINFEAMNTYNKKWFLNMLEEGVIKKESSLNQIGYYFFLSKLTIAFMRPEDTGIQNERTRNFKIQHTY